MDFEPKNFKTQKKNFPLFWEEYKELRTEHEFMFFKLLIAPNGKKINKTNIMLKSLTLSHPIQTQTKFKASLCVCVCLCVFEAPLSLFRSRPMASSKPLSLSSNQDPIVTFTAMVFRSHLFLSQALFSHKPSASSLSLFRLI